MKRTINIIAIAVFILIILGSGFWIGMKVTRKASDKMYSKMEQLYKAQQIVMTNEARSVIKKELKAFYPHVDSLAAASGIKIRKIERTTIIDHKLVYDTIPVNLTPDTADNNIVNMSMDYQCMEAKGIIDFSKTGLKLTNDDIEKMRVTLTDVQVNDKLTTIYYFDRESKKILFFRLKIGRKHYYSETYSSCKAETTTETINLIKR